jgi:DNA-binding HxlR family transcriptional regulator
MTTGDIVKKDNGMCYGHKSDMWVADKVRGLMRTDLDHEPTCTGARDRIVYLSQEVYRLTVLAEQANEIFNLMFAVRHDSDPSKIVTDNDRMLERRESIDKWLTEFDKPAVSCKSVQLKHRLECVEDILNYFNSFGETNQITQATLIQALNELKDGHTKRLEYQLAKDKKDTEG